MYLDRQTLRRMAGEVIVCGFERPALDATLKEIHREVGPLGLIVFDRNVTDAAQATELNRELKAHDPHWLIAIDQEGGQVARLTKGVSTWPPLRDVGATNDAGLAEQMGHGIASEMRALGYDINFAPVLDVDTNADNPIIGARAFSRDEKICASLGAAFVRGHQRAHVGASAKHFPGHGDTSQDSHHALPRLPHERERMEAIEWPPFRAAIAAGVSSIMTAHVCLDAIDPNVPATVSKKVLQDILREQWNFDGVIVADDVDMKGLSLFFAPNEVGPLALYAGCDVLLSCHNNGTTLSLYEGIVRATESGAIPHDLLQSRAKKAEAWRRRWRAPVLPAKQAQTKLQSAMQQNQHWLTRWQRGTSAS